MVFFSEEVEQRGIGPTLESYIFATDANISNKAGTQHPQMLNRFFSSLLHGLIHVGHGCEFESPGMCAEGMQPSSTWSVIYLISPQVLL